MGPLLVVFGDPNIKVGLQLVDGVVDLLAERDPVKLVQDSAMEALADPVCLRALGLCAGGYQVFCVRRSRETLYVVEGITRHGTGDQGRGHRRTIARLPLAGGFAGRRRAV